MTQSRTWMATEFDLSPESHDFWTKFSTDCTRFRGSLEVCPESGRKHWQIRFTLKRTKTFRTLKKIICKTHFEKATQDDFIYELKQDSTLIWDVDNRKQGARNDLIEVRQAIESGCTSMKQLRRDFPLETAKYRGWIQEVIADTAPPLDVPEITLQPWQEELLEKLEQPASARSIMFYVDVAGGKGKSTFAHYIVAKYEDKTQILTPGRVIDMAYVLDVNTEILIIDCPRCKAEHLQYSFLEEVKNRLFTSYKYQPTVKKMRTRPHIIVFMNEYPDTTKLTSDRYEIKEI